MRAVAFGGGHDDGDDQHVVGVDGVDGSAAAGTRASAVSGCRRRRRHVSAVDCGDIRTVAIRRLDDLDNDLCDDLDGRREFGDSDAAGQRRHPFGGVAFAVAAIAAVAVSAAAAALSPAFAAGAVVAGTALARLVARPIGDALGAAEGGAAPAGAVESILSVRQLRQRVQLQDVAGAARALRVRQGSAVQVPVLRAPHQAQEQPDDAHRLQAPAGVAVRREPLLARILFADEDAVARR